MPSNVSSERLWEIGSRVTGLVLLASCGLNFYWVSLFPKSIALSVTITTIFQTVFIGSAGVGLLRSHIRNLPEFLLDRLTFCSFIGFLVATATMQVLGLAAGTGGLPEVLFFGLFTFGAAYMFYQKRKFARQR